ncbi:MAG: thiamine pyrophosphate-dependent dehydrogenase E1 component subunit alpha [Anaerolineae bacterium]|nr:thiamine pyrophosphate-dependent dehydrogenase E1 component subunit alpha [Anaerolineae bacterium]
MTYSNLDRLADPTQFHHPLDISGCDPALLAEQLKMMLVIRLAEEKIGDMVTAGEINCPCHLGIGQEAIAVGLSTHLQATDRVFGAHRSHSHYLALGGDVFELFAEVLGRVGGCAKGMGGSMHLYDGNIGFAGSVPIVGATIPIAVGAALAAKMDNQHQIAVSYFGDGATEEGVFHESLNLAAMLKLPIVFVCENNLFASHMHIRLRQPGNSTARFAQAHHIPAEIVDGNDVVKMTAVAQKAVEHARSGAGPFFLETVTYRWRGHVGPREDTDVGLKRSDDLVLWKGRDPVQRLAAAMENAGIMSPDNLVNLHTTVKSSIEDAWQRAAETAFPPQTALLDLVYFSNQEALL